MISVLSLGFRGDGFRFKSSRWLCVVQPIADRVAKNVEIISKSFSTNQNSAHGIYDSRWLCIASGFGFRV